MSAASNIDRPQQISPSRPARPLVRWLLYCLGICLELLGMAFMGAVVVVFFGQVDTRILLSLTAIGMILFYSGWFCVRQGSRQSPIMKGGDNDASGARTGNSEATSSASESSQGAA